MTCREALNRMLEADPAALRREAGADPALEEHLAGCARCRRVAAALAAELGTLDAGLEELATTGGATAARGEVASASRLPEARRTVSARGRGGRAWIPLAAAAALAAVLVLGRDGDGPSPDPAGPGGGVGPVAAGELARVAVTLPTDRGAAVVSTRNPNITVVWLYERSER